MDQPSFRKSFVFSVLLHGLILFLILFNFQFSSQHFVLKNNTNEIVQATVMTAMPSPKPVEKPLQPPKIIPAPPVVKPQEMVQPEPPAPVKPLPRMIPVAKPVVIPPKPDVIALNIKKQKQLQKDLLQKQLEKQLLADMKKQQQIKRDKALQKSMQEQMRNLSQKSLQQMSNDLAVTHSQTDKMHGIVNKYRALILEAIEHKWLIPGNANKNLATKLLIKLEPGGTVTDVEIVSSSGNVGLDNSARSAVFKASPLPVPSKPDEFELFKQFEMVFRPVMFE